jgi:hypothetical protein
VQKLVAKFVNVYLPKAETPTKELKPAWLSTRRRIIRLRQPLADEFA